MAEAERWRHGETERHAPEKERVRIAMERARSRAEMGWSHLVLDASSTVENRRFHRFHEFARRSHGESTEATRPVESGSSGGSKNVKSCDFTI